MFCHAKILHETCVCFKMKYIQCFAIQTVRHEFWKIYLLKITWQNMCLEIVVMVMFCLLWTNDANLRVTLFFHFSVFGNFCVEKFTHCSVTLEHCNKHLCVSEFNIFYVSCANSAAYVLENICVKSMWHVGCVVHRNRYHCTC